MKKEMKMAGIAFAISFMMIYVLYYLLSFAPFGSGTVAWGDGIYQYLDIFSCLKNILQGKMDMFYTMSDSLGGDLLSVFSYYLASPWNLLIVFFELDQLLVFFNLLVAIKISLSASTMSIL